MRTENSPDFCASVSEPQPVLSFGDFKALLFVFVIFKALIWMFFVNDIQATTEESCLHQGVF